MEEVKIGAMRGRNPDNPSERGKSNGNYQQRLEVNENGISNTITSVQKDNLVIEPTEDTATTICLNSKVDGKQPSIAEPKVEQVGNIYPDTENFKNPQSGRVYSEQGLAPTINTCQGGNREPKIIDDTYANREAREYEDYSPALRSDRGGLTVSETQQYRIRKLTPRECFRLMDVDDADIDKIQTSGVSNSQQYKMAGNSIVVSCLYHLFRKMFVEPENEQEQLTLF